MSKRSKCWKILLDELQEQTHVENVEDVIFWALEEYSKRKTGTLGEAVAFAIIERIKEEESQIKRPDKGHFICLQCKCQVPEDYCLKTEGYCHLCDPNITTDELLSFLKEED